MSTLQAWLDQYGFGKYAELFAKNDIGPDVLPVTCRWIQKAR
jgi:hypothetical protein